MKHLIIVNAVLYIVICVLLAFILCTEPQSKVKNAEANDIVYTVKRYWPDVEYAISTMPVYDIDYIVLDADGRTIGASEESLRTDYSYNYIHKDYSVDILKNGKTQGKIIFINNEDVKLKNEIVNRALLFVFLLFAKDILVIIYIQRNIFIPIRKMNMLAMQIARGNYDISFGRDDNGSFGAFSESFGIMREELLYAKKMEQAADKSRREAIASISHDIKNPTASIQAIAEYRLLTADSDELRQDFQIIVDKTNQINGMILNLHTSMLTDLDSLAVNLETTESIIIEKALRQADFKKKTGELAIPECLVVADKVRIFQIMDNIISNSYKYADTEIKVSSYFEDDYLCVCIKDFGSGVKKEEEIFLTQKYFRGQNAQEKEGSGMGLYITEYLIKRMKGKMLCLSKENEWFEVKIWLMLAA